MLISLPNALGDAVTNMAIDTSLLESIPTGTAVFRHYGWTEPSFTFGYTQRYQEVSKLIGQSYTLCRRPTGGGIVDHRDDWTYALILNANVPAAQIAPIDFYQRVHLTIQRSIQQQGVACSLAPCPRLCTSAPAEQLEPAHQSNATSQCFVSPATNDVLSQSGLKIAGAALKRTRDGLLLQGSIAQGALPEDFNFADFQKSMKHKLADEFELPLAGDMDLRQLFDGSRIDQARRRYKSRDWTQKR